MSLSGHKSLYGRPNRAQLFVRHKYTVFIMGGTVAVWSPIPMFFIEELQTLSLQPYINHHYH